MTAVSGCLLRVPLSGHVMESAFNNTKHDCTRHLRRQRKPIFICGRLKQNVRRSAAMEQRVVIMLSDMLLGTKSYNDYQLLPEDGSKEQRISVKNAPPCHFIWTIHSFSQLIKSKTKCLRSGQFEVGGFKWFISFHFVKGTEAGINFFALDFGLFKSFTDQPNQGLDVGFTLRMINQIHSDHREARARQVYNAGHKCYRKNILPIGDLYDPSKGFIVEGACVVEVKFTVFGVIE
ncbi:Ubiquitin carboxyl-terminal hydrolase 12 [Acorus calamus]|uniref:Ubiquitin carboxyl-terminal hydrolase 12 n=1 Tax=Acorus calamus TaxID=4465 RepID=A0AAV9DSF5_ACOCL|nr:Ubiquitin carboxyl-terminal hydrolase 12 [Acorus calamus]